MATKNYVVAGDGIPYLLEKNRLVEGELVHFHNTGEVRRFDDPNSMTRASVRKALLGPKEFEFSYRYEFGTDSGRDSRKDSGGGSRTSVAIRFGCTTFKGENYRRLRKWALAK